MERVINNAKGRELGKKKGARLDGWSSRPSFSLTPSLFIRWAGRPVYASVLLCSAPNQQQKFKVFFDASHLGTAAKGLVA